MKRSGGRVGRLMQTVGVRVRTAPAQRSYRVNERSVVCDVCGSFAVVRSDGLLLCGRCHQRMMQCRV